MVQSTATNNIGRDKYTIPLNFNNGPVPRCAQMMLWCSIKMVVSLACSTSKETCLFWIFESILGYKKIGTGVGIWKAFFILYKKVQLCFSMLHRPKVTCETGRRNCLPCLLSMCYHLYFKKSIQSHHDQWCALSVRVETQRNTCDCQYFDSLIWWGSFMTIFDPSAWQDNFMRKKVSPLLYRRWQLVLFVSVHISYSKWESLISIRSFDLQ